MSEQHPSLQQQFFAESRQILDEIEYLLAGECVPDQAAGERLHCIAHGLHGAALTMGYVDFARLVKALERCLKDVTVLGEAQRREAVLAALAWLRQYLYVVSIDGSMSSEDARLDDLCARLDGECAITEPLAMRKIRLQFLVGRMLMGADVLLEQAWQILRERSTLCTVHEPQIKPAGTLWQVDLLSACSDAQLQTMLSHIADPGSLRISPMQDVPSLAKTVEMDWAYAQNTCFQLFRLAQNWFAVPAESVSGVTAVASQKLCWLPVKQARGADILLEWEGALVPVFNPYPDARKRDWLLMIMNMDSSFGLEALRIDELGALMDGAQGRRFALPQMDGESVLDGVWRLDDGRRVWLPHPVLWREKLFQRARDGVASPLAKRDLRKMLGHAQRGLDVQTRLNAGFARLALQIEALQGDMALACRQQDKRDLLAVCERARQTLQAFEQQLQSLGKNAASFERSVQKWNMSLQKIINQQTIIRRHDDFSINKPIKSERMKKTESKLDKVQSQSGRLSRQILEKEWGALDQ